MAAERLNRTGNQRLEIRTFANLPRNLCCHAFIRRASHQLQFMPHLSFGKEVQKWRLLQLNRQSLLEHDVEDFFTRLVLEVGQQDRIFLRKRGLAVEVSPHHGAGDGGERDNCDDCGSSPASVWSTAFRQKRSAARASACRRDSELFHQQSLFKLIEIAE